MLLDFFRELIWGGTELSTELLHLTKNSLLNFLGMFKALQFLRFWVYQKILVDFFVELISGVTELLTELLDLKQNPSEIFWVSLKFLGFWVYRKMLLEFFLELCRGGTRTVNRPLAFNKKIRPKFFGYVQSTVVSWILSLSKNVNRVFSRSHLGGTRTLKRTLEFNKKFTLKFFGYV